MPHSPSPDARPSDEIVELVFELTDTSYFSVGLSADQSCLVRLERSIQQVDGPTVEFFTARDATADAVRERAERTSSVDAARVVYDRDAELMFQLAVTDQCLATTLEAGGAIPQAVRARDGTGTVSALVPATVPPRDVIERVLDHHPAAELVKRRPRDILSPVFTRGTLHHLVRDRLTDRQWEVLETAYRNGYWDRPRECTGEELADDLGITSATFSQHVRAAYRNVFNLVFGGALPLQFRADDQ